MERKDSKDEESGSPKMSAIIETNDDDRNQESEQSGFDDRDRINTKNHHSTVRQSNHEEPARLENVSYQQDDVDKNEDDDDAPLYMKRRRWQAWRNPGEKQSSRDKHHHHHHPKSPHAQSTSLPGGRPRRNRPGKNMRRHMPQKAAYKASPPSTDKTTAEHGNSIQQSTRESNIKKVPYKVAQDPLGHQFQPQEDPSQKASNNEPYEEVPVATADETNAAAAAAAATSQEQHEIDGFWDTFAASTTGLQRQNRLEDQHEMRPPLTAEQRLRTPIRLPTSASTAMQQRPPPQGLVEATPVDMQAYHQQRQCPQQVQQCLQNLPRALTEEEYQEQVRRRQCKNAIYGFSVLGLVLLVVVVVIMVLVKVINNKTHDQAQTCFSTAQELRDVADRFMQLRVSRNHTLIQTEITQKYGRVEKWCVGDIQDFSELFSGSRNAGMLMFNRDISQWNMSSATDVSHMFSGRTLPDNEVYVIPSRFNQDISSWDVSHVVDMSHMFSGATSFDQNISSWNMSYVTDLSRMFSGASSFNQPLDSWNVSGVTDMSSMFGDAASFNQPLDSWNVSYVTDMSWMFYGAASFNQPLDPWNVSGVTDMGLMFHGASSFNQPLDSWNVLGVTDMSRMFSGVASFNQPLNSWNVSYVTDMIGMFSRAASFNQPLDSWNVLGVTDLSWMFSGAASFNQPLDSWDVSGVIHLYFRGLDGMFSGALSFNQNLCTWGQRLPKDYWPPFNMLNMFVNTSCPMTDDPDFLGANPPGPFCHRCA